MLLIRNVYNYQISILLDKILLNTLLVIKIILIKSLLIQLTKINKHLKSFEETKKI